MSGSATPNVPDAPRNVLQLKDADDLMGKYVQLASLTIDEFTPEAVEAIFGIKFGPRHDSGHGGFVARFDQSVPNDYLMDLSYSNTSLFGMLDVRTRWLIDPPTICVSFQKLKAELEKHGWRMERPMGSSYGGPARDSFVRSDSAQKWYVGVEWRERDCVLGFHVRHEVAVNK